MIQIVNHSFGYYRLLSYQLSSLILHPPKCPVLYWLFSDPTDTETTTVVDAYRSNFPSNTKLVWMFMDVGLMKNRAYGRNIACQGTPADFVWFTDTDYFFGEGSLDSVFTQAKKIDAELMWPQNIFQTSWETGEKLIESITVGVPSSVSSADCQVVKMRRAIGGIQISPGSVVRKTGYCPTYGKVSLKNWNFRSDRGFRTQFTKKVPIELPNVIRIRHARKGYRMENEQTGAIN